MYSAKTRVQDNDETIGCATVVLVSASYNKHCFITLSLWLYDLWTHI